MMNFSAAMILHFRYIQQKWMMLAVNCHPNFLIYPCVDCYAGLHAQRILPHLDISVNYLILLEQVPSYFLLVYRKHHFTTVWLVFTEFVLILSLVFADPTNICLRHSLANLVACAIGTCDSGKPSHLWHLVFAPEKLQGTYFAGSMVWTLFNWYRDMESLLYF